MICTCGKWEETESAGRDQRVVHAERVESPKAQVGIDWQYMRKAEKRSKAHVGTGDLYMRKMGGNRKRR